MGQYKQWRHYRETDQRLHSQLSRLSNDLISMQIQEQQLEQNLSLSDNSLILSLLAQLLLPPPSPAQEPQAEPTPVLSSEAEVTLLAKTELTVPTETESTITDIAESTAPVAHEDLDLSPEIVLSTETESTISETILPVAYGEPDLSAEEREMLSDEQSQTAPIRAIPWWFRNTPINHTGQEGPFTDQQSSRTNQLVERWLERWGRSEDEPQQREEQR